MASEPKTLLELEFGDDGIVVQKHPDGMYTLDVSNARIVLSGDQFSEFCGGVMDMLKACSDGPEDLRSALED